MLVNFYENTSKQ